MRPARIDRPVDKRRASHPLPLPRVPSQGASKGALSHAGQLVDCGPKLVANPEHLALIRRGVEVWNAWRTKEPSFQTFGGGPQQGGPQGGGPRQSRPQWRGPPWGKPQSKHTSARRTSMGRTFAERTSAGRTSTGRHRPMGDCQRAPEGNSRSPPRQAPVIPSKAGDDRRKGGLADGDADHRVTTAEGRQRALGVFIEL